MAKTAKSNHVEKPSAWVVSSEKGRKSIKNGKVYLKDKEEFQIELFNPLTDCVLADISQRKRYNHDRRSLSKDSYCCCYWFNTI